MGASHANLGADCLREQADLVIGPFYDQTVYVGMCVKGV